MRALRMYLFGGLWNLIIALSLLSGNLGHAARADDTQWSFDVNNISLPEAMRQLSVLTGVKIYAQRYPLEKVLSKSYKNHTIGNIIRDLLKGTNYTSVWHYSERRLESIEIKFFESGGGAPSVPSAPERSVPTVNPQQRFRSALTRRSYRPIPPPFAQRDTIERPEAEEMEKEALPEAASADDKEEPKVNEKSGTSDDEKAENEDSTGAASEGDKGEAKDKEKPSRMTAESESQEVEGR